LFFNPNALEVVNRQRKVEDVFTKCDDRRTNQERERCLRGSREAGWAREDHIPQVPSYGRHKAAAQRHGDAHTNAERQRREMEKSGKIADNRHGRQRQYEVW
jgi:hypothetical protein